MSKDSDNEEFVVEKILGKRISFNRRVEYFVKWLGYPCEDNTWELEEDLQCKDLINAFNQIKVSPKSKDSASKSVLEKCSLEKPLHTAGKLNQVTEMVHDNSSDSDGGFDFANLQKVFLSSVKASKKKKEKKKPDSDEKIVDSTRDDEFAAPVRLDFSSDLDSSHQDETKFYPEDFDNDTDKDISSNAGETKNSDENTCKVDSQINIDDSSVTEIISNQSQDEEDKEETDEEDYDDSDYFIDDNGYLDEKSASNLLNESRVNTQIRLSDSSDEEWQRTIERGKLICSAKKKTKSRHEGTPSAVKIKVTDTAIIRTCEGKSSRSSSTSTNRLYQRLGIDFALDEPIPKKFFSSSCNKTLTRLFQSCNIEFFDGKLDCVTVSWSGRLTSSAGIFHGKRSTGEAYINLSYKILSRQPSLHLIETLLHEMIHAFLFITGTRDRNSHGPNFRRKMKQINQQTGFNVTVTHSYHDAVNALQIYVWRCDGICKSQAAFNYGFIKRPVNRPPDASSKFYSRHQTLCGGKYTQITAGEQYEFALSCIK